jgi:hypothetical protein
VRKRGRPLAATTALIPAAARAPESLSALEATLNGEAVETFATAVGGRAQLAAVLAIGSGTSDIEKVAIYLHDPRYREWSLRRLCTQAGITVADLFSAYKKALITRAHIEATHLIVSQLTPVVADVMRRAAPIVTICPSCQGAAAGGAAPCLTCNSTGQVQTEPDLERQKVALELGQLLEKKGGIVMQQNTLAAAGAFSATGSGALEQLHQAVGDLLFSPTRRRHRDSGETDVPERPERPHDPHEAEIIGDPPIDDDSRDDPPIHRRPDLPGAPDEDSAHDD